MTYGKDGKDGKDGKGNNGDNGDDDNGFDEDDFEDDDESIKEDFRKMGPMDRDIKNAADDLSVSAVRYLVDGYYILQKNRIHASNQVRAMATAENPEPHEIIAWLAASNRHLENQIKGALDRYTSSRPIGQWMRSITGIGPVISAGMLAHIDIEKADTVGSIWRFAGLDPTVKWEKGQKRPWNATLKTLCWKLGESFVKVSNHPDAVYGIVYRGRKALEFERNETGAYAEQAAAILVAKNYGKTTDAYKAYIIGKLPPAHVHARACRYTVKLFLAHLHEVMFIDRYDKKPPLPYPIAHLGHTHKIPPPGI